VPLRQLSPAARREVVSSALWGVVLVAPARDDDAGAIMVGGEVEVRRLRVDDSDGLIACFGRCYAGTYVGEAFRDPELLARRVADGSLRSVVAVAPDAEIVGHMGLSARDGGALTAEAGNTVVDPRYRGHHLAQRLAIELATLALDVGLVGFQHYPTTAHPVMQKLAVQGNGVEVGVLLEYIPAATQYVGFAPTRDQGWLAAVAVYEPLAPAPRRSVCLPARYDTLLAALYERARLDRVRDLAPSRPDARSVIATEFERRRGILRILVESVGADLADRVAGACQAHPGAPVLADLALADPCVEAAVEALAELGFCFGALLPEYVSQGDILRLQRPSGVRCGEPVLANPMAQDLLAVILAERLPPVAR